VSRRAVAVHERLAPFPRKVLAGLYPFKSMRKSPFPNTYSFRYSQILTLFRSKFDQNLIVLYLIRNRYDRNLALGMSFSFVFIKCRIIPQRYEIRLRVGVTVMVCVWELLLWSACGSCSNSLRVGVALIVCAWELLLWSAKVA
jgi:hypothetical protein